MIFTWNFDRWSYPLHRAKIFHSKSCQTMIFTWNFDRWSYPLHRAKIFHSKSWQTMIVTWNFDRWSYPLHRTQYHFEQPKPVLLTSPTSFLRRLLPNTKIPNKAHRFSFNSDIQLMTKYSFTLNIKWFDIRDYKSTWNRQAMWAFHPLSPSMPVSHKSSLVTAL